MRLIKLWRKQINQYFEKVLLTELMRHTFVLHTFMSPHIYYCYNILLYLCVRGTFT